MILAVDPGRDKCGVALASEDGAFVWRAIVARPETARRVAALVEEHGLTKIVLGHATAARDLAGEIKAIVPQLQIVTVNEANSTFEARALYWQENPPRGWRKIVPLSLQVPPEPLDDFAAVILARRFLASNLT